MRLSSVSWSAQRVHGELAARPDTRCGAVTRYEVRLRDGSVAVVSADGYWSPTGCVRDRYVFYRDDGAECVEERSFALRDVREVREA